MQKNVMVLGLTSSILSSKNFAQWITGFVDAEGSFSIVSDRDYIRFLFRIRLHIDDVFVLEKIQKYFNIGYVRKENNNNSALYVVSNFLDLQSVIIPFFQ